MLHRRSFLGVAAAAGVAVALPGCTTRGQTGELLRSTVPLPPAFSVPLPLPPVLAPVREPDRDRYRVEAREVDVEILPGRRTRVMAYDGLLPGPTLETTRGRPVVVEHVNSLAVPMVVHLHGGVVPAASDGFPTDLVLPDEGEHRSGVHVHDPDALTTRGSRTYHYPTDQRAALLWYHDHRMDFTGPMVYRGLAGMHVVRDEEEAKLPLPRGERELLLLLQDKAFGEDAELLYPSLDPTLTTTPGVEQHAMEGVLGDVVLVNGAPWPTADVTAVRHRLRIVNGSNARRWRLRLDPAPRQGSPFVRIGSDGGLLTAPRRAENLTLAPAERVDVLVDFGAYPVGTDVVLRNDLGEGRMAEVMRFRVARRGGEDSALPRRLADVERLPAPGMTREFRFTLGDVGGHRGWVINGRPFDPQRMDARVVPGRVEKWRFVTDVHHPVHVHLAHFQVVSRGGRAPEVGDEGWKDTVDVRPHEPVEVLLRFPNLPGRYVMHCHNLEHEDMMMMSAFEVLG